MSDLLPMIVFFLLAFHNLQINREDSPILEKEPVRQNKDKNLVQNHNYPLLNSIIKIIKIPFFIIRKIFNYECLFIGKLYELSLKFVHLEINGFRT